MESYDYKTIKPVACLNGFLLKMIAVSSMLIDHIGAVLSPYQMGFRYIGRIAFPIYVFLIVEGFYHTHDIRKYELRLLLFAAISEIPFDLAFNGSVLEFTSQNVFFTLFLGLLMLDLIRRAEQSIQSTGMRIVLEIVILFAFIMIANFLQTDYSGGGVLLIFWFYCFRNRPVFKYVGLALIACVFFGLIECWCLIAVIPMLLYNGERGFRRTGGLYSGRSRGAAATLVKYLFYLFYPVHLLILHGIDVLQ
ncbi:MAG: conjugal transfer protein TraX [Clostridiales bacterium]|nr:conjugal transfer protein TraX [Clostridiales bacterium]